MSNLQILRIKEKIAIACRLKPDVFGATGHGWQMNPPLPVAEADRFEQGNGVTLPPCYREFLCDIGNGGAGPQYGLEPLRAGWLETVVPSLRADVWRKAISARQDLSMDERMADVIRWVRDELSSDFYVSGRPVHLAYGGCSFDVLLVTAGETAGKVLMWDDTGENIFYIADNFLDWYEAWLDDSLRPHTRLEGRTAAN